ncbi:hypothetical protein RN001_008659 [Aquatica leii]|uniref:Zinc finger PHD-type domain-containing protein n=1 Tax=Aquatica leii TaxID=1421715 RepID=A0AAN7SPB6_9COLE|nr:hypothetical protein RN001_008659 [Aquatica leii]
MAFSSRTKLLVQEERSNFRIQRKPVTIDELPLFSFKYETSLYFNSTIENACDKEAALERLANFCKIPEETKQCSSKAAENVCDLSRKDKTDDDIERVYSPCDDIGADKDYQPSSSSSQSEEEEKRKSLKSSDLNKKGYLVEDTIDNITDHPMEIRHITPDKSVGNLTDPVTIRHTTPPPQPSTSTANDGYSPNVSFRVTPLQLKPFPKALPRKAGINRKKIKSAVLTDTPVKNAFEEEARERENRKKISGKLKKNFSDHKGSKCKKKGTKKEETDSDQSEEGDLCLVCLESYSNSKDKYWIQCTTCRGWAHVSCASDDDYYVCIHCLSDND